VIKIVCIAIAIGWIAVWSVALASGAFILVRFIFMGGCQ
jgi:hypothetical protein